METPLLITQLKELRTVKPDPVYMRWSLAAICAEKQTAPFRTPAWVKKFWSLRTLYASAGAASALGLMLFLTLSTKTPEPTALASLRTETLRAEEPLGEEGNKLPETAYYKNLAPAINLALTDIIDPSTNWKSSEQIKHVAKLYNDQKN